MLLETLEIVEILVTYFRILAYVAWMHNVRIKSRGEDDAVDGLQRGSPALLS